MGFYNKIVCLLAVASMAISPVFSQENSDFSPKDTTEQFFFISVSYGGQLPGADLAERFGPNSCLGGQFTFKAHTGLTLGLEWSFLFSKNVKNVPEIFDGLYNSDGYFLNSFGEPGLVAFFQRGHVVTGNIGKIFPITGPNDNSGIQLKFGAGFMRHRIRIDNDFQAVPYLSGDYRKLYDRLTSGFVMSQFIGYTHFSTSRLFNFYAGFEIFEGFTRGRRDWQADLFAPYTETRFEILYGVKVGWMIPFRRRKVADFYVF